MGEGFVTTDDGVRIWWAVDGAGPPLVLAHGGPGLADDLGPLAALVDDRATVVRYHQRGVGRSDPAGPHTLDRYLADLEALRRHLGHETWIVGGHSFGATLALRYALAHPDRTRGLLAVAGVGAGWEWHATAEAEADRRLGPERRARRDELGARRRTEAEEVEWRTLQWLPDFSPDDPERALQQARLLAEAGGAICWQANRDLRAEARATEEAELLDRARELDVPALFLQGEVDPRPASSVASLVGAMTQAEVVVVPGSGHRPWAEAATPVRQAITRWLDEVAVR